MRYNFKQLKMKPVFLRLILCCFLFSIHSSFAQTITKKRGKVTIYEDGRKTASGKVKNYKKQGVWKYYNDDGTLSETYTYKDDIKQGLYTFYFQGSHVAAMQGNYLNGEKKGAWTEWYLNGQIQYRLNYAGHGDDRIGLQQSWYENGHLMEQDSFSSDSKMIYLWRWFENGKLHTVEQYKNGISNGQFRYYDDSALTDSFPAKMVNYLNGKENGLMRFYKNGVLVDERNYKDGLLNGTYKTWNADGSPHTSQNFKKGILDGKSTFYTIANWVRTENYSNGKKNGEEKLADDNGKLISLSYYSAGRLDSTKTFHPNEKIASTRVYSYLPGFVRTEEFSVYKEYDDKGNLLLSGKYHFETKDGDWTTYYPNGKTKSVTPHSAGKITGTYKKWYASGKEMIEYTLEDGSVKTQPKVWDEKGKLLKPFSNAWQEIVDSSLPDEVYNDPNSYRENPGLVNPQIHFVAPRVMEEDENVPIAAMDADGSDDVGLVGDYGDKGEAEVFQYAQEMPEFPGGNDSMAKFIQRNIVYPAAYRDNGIQGKVFLSFIVEKDGTITNITELKGVAGAPDFTKEAIRVVKIMPKWVPGKMNGREVRTKMAIPISFVLR